MPIANFDDKMFVKAGAVGFPEEELLEEVIYDGKKVKKKAQLTVIHHNSGVQYRLTIDEYNVGKDGLLVQTAHIPLSEEATDKLFQYLLSKDKFAEIAHTTFYTVVESTAPLDKQSLEQLANLLKRATTNRQLETIVPSEVVGNFSAVIHQIRYKKAIAELKKMLGEEHSEKEYEKWFMDNHWIFGTEYLKTEDAKIGWRTAGDIILTSTDGYQDIIELKLPTEDILLYDASHKNWYPSEALSKAIAQALKYVQESEDVRTTIEVKEKLPFMKPRAKIVIGRSDDWDTDKFDCLRKLNAGFHCVQVMTYDHLLLAGQRMVDYYEGEVTDEQTTT